CFLCRQTGHSIKFCPRNAGGAGALPDASADPSANDSGSAICYRCGSSEHPLSKCFKRADPSNPYPFATCFICKGTGHLASQCEKNDRGLYPNGGGCRFCGSVRHLARDC
ncbi:hypothetical protein BC831DRAFT_380003, partial [Entophlyctis helioformis]